jgi:hypothetical protein
MGMQRFGNGHEMGWSACDIWGFVSVYIWRGVGCML